MYFKLKPKVGSHVETGPDGKPVTYRAEDGHVFDTDQDLVQMFPNKFEKVEVLPEGVPLPPPIKPEKEQSKKEPAKALGRDVTKRFPDAEKEDFKVFADGGEFFVTEADEPDKPLNTKPLHKKQVDSFIQKYLSG